MRKLPILIFLLVGLLNIETSAQWFQQKTISSKALDQEKTYYVGLPKGYNELDTITKYPVIVFLHGASITATDMVNLLEPFLDNFLGKFLFDKLFKVIFIIPDGSCEPYKGSFYTNSALYGNYEDYIASDMMEEIRNKYHTYSGREKWSIMGHSMGGFGAMKIALKYPEKFIGVSSLSGPLNISYFDELLPVLLSENGSAPPYDFIYSGNVTKLMFSMAGAFSPNPGATPPIFFPVNSAGTIDQSVTGLWEVNNPINFIKDWKGNPAMAIHTYCGELDEFKLAKQNQLFSDTLDKYKIQHTYKQDPYGDHVNSLFTSLPQGINFLYQVMDTAQIQIETAVKPIALINYWSIYPNPANDRFFVSGNSDHIQRIEIYNLSGQKVMQIENPTPETGINIHNLEEGVYLVSLHRSNRTVSTLRLIKNNTGN
jgi:pimeloyl-ACP methyl ester carboxylesterase